LPIVVFDIDGTLTDTVEVDVACYEAAILETIGLEIPSDWPTFDEVTDAGILARACELEGRPVPDPETEAEIAARVGALLSDLLRRAPERFLPIAGAEAVFDALRAAGWHVAMATGAWRPSAEVKLRGAGLRAEGVPLATCSDRRSRPDIIRHAVEMTAGGVEADVVCVGDGTWDGRAARSLGYGFVGVGDRLRDPALREVGAVDVLPDFGDLDRLLRAVRGALALRGGRA